MANDHERTTPVHDETKANHSADEVALRALYQRLMDGWNQGSGVAFASVFTPTATPIRAFAVHQFYTAVVMAAQQEMEDTSAHARTVLEPSRSHKSRLAPWDRPAGYRSENSRLTICVIPMVVT